MAYYYVTFRIHDKVVAGQSYQQRYDSFMGNLRTDGKGFWTDTTSFLMIESDLDTESFSHRAVKGLSPQFDLVVVTDPEDNSACCFGDVKHLEVLKSFLPRIKKLG